MAFYTSSAFPLLVYTSWTFKEPLIGLSQSSCHSRSSARDCHQAASISISLPFGTEPMSPPLWPHRRRSQSRWCRFHCALTTLQERIFPLDSVRGVLACAKQTVHRYLKGVGSGCEPNVFIPSHLIETLALPWWHTIPINLLTSGGPFSNTICLFWLQMWVTSITRYLWQAFAKCCTYNISFHLSSESVAWETGWQRHSRDNNWNCSQELWWKYRPPSDLLPMPSIG